MNHIKFDKYAHRLSIKEEICYENATELLNKSLNRLGYYKYKSKNIYKSAYKHARNKIKESKFINT